MASSPTIQAQTVAVGRRLWQRGLVAGTDGNISARLDSDRIIITPSGRAKGRLTESDLLLVDLNGNVLEGNLAPSSEMAMHLAVYRRRPEIGACVHAHPPFATAFAVAGEPLKPDVLPEIVVGVGPIALTDYAPPGTSAVPETLAPYLDDHEAFLLGNHGLMTIGRTLDEACDRMETVEQYACILYRAKQLGQVRRIPEADVKRLEALRMELNRSGQNEG